MPRAAMAASNFFRMSVGTFAVRPSGGSMKERHIRGDPVALPSPSLQHPKSFAGPAPFRDPPGPLLRFAQPEREEAAPERPWEPSPPPQPHQSFPPHHKVWLRSCGSSGSRGWRSCCSPSLPPPRPLGQRGLEGGPQGDQGPACPARAEGQRGRGSPPLSRLSPFKRKRPGVFPAK